ncbi:Hypothetical protein OINT_1001067 [Brucella intermedia LMG 3301]|uniref:Uncharacterized protein n=1 Tax=Brucella intermedia LMG 3301 TaxID=641118 RepID=C4WHM6_9HYPH|nr:Hypothetical protein OINT_1001067 [Brucella intermedia LMG 3301]
MGCHPVAIDHPRRFPINSQSIKPDFPAFFVRAPGKRGEPDHSVWE